MLRCSNYTSTVKKVQYFTLLSAAFKTCTAFLSTEKKGDANVWLFWWDCFPQALKVKVSFIFSHTL